MNLWTWCGAYQRPSRQLQLQRKPGTLGKPRRRTGPSAETYKYLPVQEGEEKKTEEKDQLCY